MIGIEHRLRSYAIIFHLRLKHFKEREKEKRKTVEYLPLIASSTRA